VRNFGDHRLYKIACGPRNEDYHWTEVMIEHARNMRGQLVMDGLSLHYYTPDGPQRLLHKATEFGEAEWFYILKTTLEMDRIIRNHSAIMDRYDPENRVALIVDEWGTWYATEPGTNPRFLYQQNSLRDALVAAVNFDIFNHHCGRVRMANIAQTVNVLQALILTEEGSDRLLLTPTYHVHEMYTVHHDATLVPLDLACEDYRHGDQAMPALSASASRDAQGRIHVTMTNLNPNQGAAVQCDLRGVTAQQVSGRVLTADRMQAHNTFEAPNQVKPVPFSGARLSGSTLAVDLPPMCVVALTLE
jgi:alpha-L-arabinofuranosidase